MKLTPGGLYHKNIMIVNDTSRVVRMTIISDAPSYGVTNYCPSDNSRCVIYAPRFINYAPYAQFIVLASLMIISIYDHCIFIEQAIAIKTANGCRLPSVKLARFVSFFH
jgi:hypothetical protein